MQELLRGSDGRKARVFVGDSIVRKTDRALNKGDDAVVCIPGAKRKSGGNNGSWQHRIYSSTHRH